MTIVEAIKCVLGNTPEGLTTKEIYDEIIERKLYSFGAKNPFFGGVPAQTISIYKIDTEYFNI